MSFFRRITVNDAPAKRDEYVRRAQAMSDDLLATLRLVEPLPSDTQELTGEEIEAQRAEFRRQYNEEAPDA